VQESLCTQMHRAETFSFVETTRSFWFFSPFGKKLQSRRGESDANKLASKIIINDYFRMHYVFPLALLARRIYCLFAHSTSGAASVLVPAPSRGRLGLCVSNARNLAMQNAVLLFPRSRLAESLISLQLLSLFQRKLQFP
jgi:hypothetical protein